MTISPLRFHDRASRELVEDQLTRRMRTRSKERVREEERESAERLREPQE